MPCELAARLRITLAGCALKSVPLALELARGASLTAACERASALVAARLQGLR